MATDTEGTTNDATGTRKTSTRGRKPGIKKAASTAKRSAAQRTSTTGKRTTGKRRANGTRAGLSSRNGGVIANARRSVKNRVPDVPGWVGILASVVGAGVAVGAGLYATRNQWMPKTREWADDFNAAFADGEADSENFDQTRHAGRESMRDDPGDDWDDIDELADASFPASDPPSFSPGKA